MRILYILGSTRSGTSALRNAITTTRFAGYGEGHLVPLLKDYLEATRKHKTDGLGASEAGTGIHQLRRDVFLRHIFHGYERYLVGQLKSEDVLDKTPTVEPIRMVPQLARYHAKALFVHCSRRHVDNVLSKLRKFPDITLERACREWAGCHVAWLENRLELGDNKLELENRELATEPDTVAERLGSYLELDTEEIEAIADKLSNGRPEQTSDRDVGDFVPIEETGWSEEEQDLVRSICGPVGARLGYGFDRFWA